ncbi:MAG: DNA-binding protein [Sulfurimonas sp. RIFCSPHIGHO2_12_FULL_36_9]|uniref:ComEA family DNA-binding protein n=1 Tax=Sulfurimonas sp. RIFCSPLOWO2_12_36_12 TaxID=1802253 RepID=UPI0008BCD76B|nr:helix-hairpin-helix domain-containing protein [Sulfurimonas sp. RIFCSPLOWO2_12_36_12]OHD99441.1 MAG: DNA-binding protein [Sulfurimonas sp. RIFCSPHIGHO2_12_FULL_36_9]OHE01686.1 MAG: DNA-binding protein [Sulfurimonas sp. RIFCSPLOWO2_12_36_12]OHE06619.1 MAG: DNA-binding protein [Sulfurimonas sp. RIFCSPLOWO2_12_FULL_36_74]
MKLLSLLIIGAALCFGAVDINKADKKELMAINGVGEAKADAILEYRKKNNCFKNIQELKEVKGFGDKFLEKNRAGIMAGECKKK